MLIYIHQYGSNTILASFRTEFISNHLLSVRINERKAPICTSTHQDFHTYDHNKKAAFLLDAQTICIQDMTLGVGGGGKVTTTTTIITSTSSSSSSSSSSSTTTIHHNHPIDFLELNDAGTFILFRDIQHCLWFMDVHNHTQQIKTCLLKYCHYVQWVPGSDVIVAQDDGRQMYIWYNTKVLDQVRFSHVFDFCLVLFQIHAGSSHPIPTFHIQ